MDHFVYAVDPPSLEKVEATWVSTREGTHRLGVARPGAAPLGRDASPRGFRIFAVRAVDQHGAMSEPAVRAFFGENVAPITEIVTPRPSAAFDAILPPNPIIRWRATDPDGRITGYKFRLFSTRNPDSRTSSTSWDSRSAIPIR